MQGRWMREQESFRPGEESQSQRFAPYASAGSPLLPLASVASPLEASNGLRQAFVDTDSMLPGALVCFTHNSHFSIRHAFFHRPSQSNVLASICGSPCGVKVPADDWATGVDGTRSGMGLTCEEPNSCDTETKNHLASDAKPNTETSDIAQVARSQGSPKC